jgi:hypothetical protein
MNGGSNMSRRVALAAGLVLLLALDGCATSRRIATHQELADLSPTKDMTVYATDDRVYRLKAHSLTDSAIYGSGELLQRGQTTSFTGQIPLSEIVAIKSNSRSVLKGLAVVGITALFVAYVVDGTDSDGGGLTAVENFLYHFPYSGGTGSSCPYVYAWDGQRYQLEAEPFGIAWGKALEMTTVHVLPAARPDHGVVRLRLTNERAETHYVNSIQLREIELGSAPAAVLDGEGRAWPLSHPMAPITASDQSGSDILPQLASADGRMWECDPSSLTVGSGYEDVLEVGFARPPHDSMGSLVITGINTTLSSAVYSYLCRIVGDQTAVLAHAIETDPELIDELRAYTRDASLEARVWNGSEWELAGTFQPEANAVTFTRALRIRIPEGAGETVRVRLRSMADVWKIDAISADWGDSRPLAMTPVKMLSAVGPAGEDMRPAISTDDRNYAVLLPPDQVNLTFAAPSLPAGARVAYAVAGRGYLLEWDLPATDNGPATVVSLVPQEGRIEFLKEVLKHRELALQPVYEAWRKVRTP